MMFSIDKLLLNFTAGPGEQDQNPGGQNAYYDINNVSHVIISLVEIRFVFVSLDR
jgi:hypothetical protein